MTSLPVASMLFSARAGGMLSSIASTTPQRMPMSRFARSDWLGSSTSPPLITRSNLSFGPIAALAAPGNAMAAADPDRTRKSRRDNADIGAPPSFVWSDDAPAFPLLQAAGAISIHSAAMLGLEGSGCGVGRERVFRPAVAGGGGVSPDTRRSHFRRDDRGDGQTVGPDRPLVAGLRTSAGPCQGYRVVLRARWRSSDPPARLRRFP